MSKQRFVLLDLCTRLCLLSLLAAAGGPVWAQDDLPRLDLDRRLRLDYSGHWEKDYARSDKWEEELSRVLRQRQEAAARQQSGLGGGGGPSVGLNNVNLRGSGGRGANLIDQARLAEYISRHSTMEIIQDRRQIRIERRGEAPLICSLDTGPTETFASPHGSELCGWDQQQLVFIIELPDELSIRHRFTVSADGTELRMVTSISSHGSAPFNLIQAFNRYEAPPENFDCVLTLSRGQVCSRREAQQ